MDNLLDRITAITDALNQLHSELYTRALSPSPARTHTFLDEPRSLEVLTNFKAAVDELRRFLWYYIDELAMRQGEDADALVDGCRIRRAAQMLRALRTDSVGPDRAIGGCAQTFMEQITAVVESYVEARPEPASTPGQASHL